MNDGKEQTIVGGSPRLLQEGGPEGWPDRRENQSGQVDTITAAGHCQESGASAMGKKQGFVYFVEAGAIPRRKIDHA